MRQIHARGIALVFGLLLFRLLLGSAAQGDSSYSACIACHGADGAGNTALGAPAIAGQSESYIQRQLTAFRDGIRGAAEGDSYGAQMRPFALNLSDAQIDAMAVYVAGLSRTVQVSGAEVVGDPRRGASLYNGNCGACHGGKGEGNAALHSPALAGLDATYLKRQYANFASGVRGTHKSDRYGRQMAMMARTLVDDAALDDVVAYLGSLAGSADLSGGH